ncbi:MAG: trypsin-like serine protease, partial [Propionibacteriaceae bacterium]|nr:trypsin-like serine protease [Propionibacteriaceae bacterium]
GMTRLPVLRLLFIITLATTFAATLGCEEEETVRVNGVSVPIDDAANYPSGIVGGSETGSNDWPGVVALRMGGSWGGLCSGTLIHPSVVLTAGHCVNSDGTNWTYNPGQISIQVGTDINTAPTLAHAQEARHHPDWTGEIQDMGPDVALIHLDTPITGVTPYSLRDFPMPYTGNTGKLVGYGQDHNGGMMDPGGSGTQREGDTTLLAVYSTLIQVGDPATTCQG